MIINKLLNMRGFLLFTFFYIITIQGYSQNIILKGYIQDIKEKPIAYVNLGIENRGIGCMSDSEGHFSLSIPDSLKNMTLTASHISYQKYTRNIKKLTTEKNIVITLESRNIKIPEISIYPKKGKWIKNKGIRLPGSTLKIDSLGEETGIFANINKDALMEQIRFNILKCSYDSVKIRINLYQIDKDLNAIPIITSPIYKMITHSSDKKEIKINTETRPYLFKGKVAIMLEMIEIYGNGELLFPTYLASSPYKKLILDKFEKIPYSMGLAIYVRN